MSRIEEQTSVQSNDGQERQGSRREFLIRSTAAGIGVATAASWRRVMGANERIRLGVIGPGARGRQVLRFFQANPTIEVAALCDIYDEQMRQAREQTGGTAKEFTDYRKLLEEPNLDAILIATPDHWHRQMAVDACNSGRDVYIEKPLTYAIE
ncbi:MAG: Gfo/Idh/MocA family oxidoreductase, partial [Acidobacteriota bacterium]